MYPFRFVATLAGLTLTSVVSADEPPLLTPIPEWVTKIKEILEGGDPSRAKPSPLILSKTRYNWEWLAQRHGLEKEDVLSLEKFQGGKERFAQLDRNGDKFLEAADFDWSERSPFVQQQGIASAIFNRLNEDGNGEISAKEWQALYEQVSGEKKSLSSDDLRRMLFPQANRRATIPPTRWTRLRGFLSGELGSMQEGPNPGEQAPNFNLATPNSKQRIKLSDFQGKKPVVLVFGNFT